ncbi:MAG TPA: response regulator [Candidatus Acidoferrum sp.]|nr:response regulator [Candidatus Acidoferrum sp.]
MHHHKFPRILVVDDNRAIHEDFKKILCHGGDSSPDLEAAETALFGAVEHRTDAVKFRVDSALQGQEALQLMEAALREGDPYAMAFMDVRMPPGWDGIETTEAIWKAYPDLQVVICTAYSDYSWTEMQARLGYTDRLVILKKPFDNIEVLQLAHAMTEKWKLLQQTRAQMNELEHRVAERTVELQATNTQLQAEVAERKAVEAALRESQELVLRQERLAVVGQLAAGVAHDYNNIMTIVQGHAELLIETENLSEDATSSLKEISTAAVRATKLTQQLLAFSRKQVIRLADVDLASVTRNMSVMLKRAVGENITLQLAFPAQVPTVRADVGSLEQVLMNLVVNARDAMPKGGELTIGINPAVFDEVTAKENSERRAGKFVCLSVRDTGTGMSAETMKKIFEPFFTTKDIGKGTGLGLATVYGIVKQHRGWLEVSSELERGSEFLIYLPQACAGAAANSAPAPLQVAATTTILVVEDEAPVRRIVKNVCERAGFRVLEAETGRQAIEIATTSTEIIDVVLTDMLMPEGVSGAEVARQLRQRCPGLKVIFTSGYSASSDHGVDLQEGVNFIAKPYSPPALLQLIRKNLAKV